MSVPEAFSLATFAIAIVAIGAFLVYSQFHPTEDRFARAERQFLEATIEAPDPRHSFSGRSAQVVRKLQDNTNGEATTHVLTIYAMNSSGEYFVFRSDGSSPTVRHLDQTLAKVILKHAYVSPQRDA